MHYGDAMVRDILLLQKRELESRLREPYIHRDINPHWNLRDGMIKVITGPRRAGKSFYAMHLLQQAGPFGYVNFDDERLVGLDNYDEIINGLDSVYGSPDLILFDEIQNLQRWELFLNRLQRQGRLLVVTGSNANLLSSELSTHLTGRHLAAAVFPFSFGEYLKALGREQTAAEKAESLFSYAADGGYPEPLLKRTDRGNYLRTLLQATIYKDIIRRFNIRGVQGIEDLALYLMSNVGRQYSLKALSEVTKCRSPRTIEKYMGYLREAYLVFDLRRFSFKVRDQIRSPGKIYCTDSGMAVSAGFRFSPDRGALYENLVAGRLKQGELAGRVSIFYWKGGQNEEVDFVVKEGPRVTRLIQVCADVSNERTLKREMRSLLWASQELGCDDLLLLNERFDRVETISWHGIEKRVRILPLWHWLSEPEITAFLTGAAN